MSKKSELENTGIISTKIIETSTAWDGTALPNYPQAAPEISIYKYTFPPHTVTNPHFHRIINCGVVLSGTLTIVCKDGRYHDFHAGEPLVEADEEIHHGENRGDEDAVVIMFYAGGGNIPLSIPED
ncbi:MAG: cupin domain-containing protein [Muribaculaceae bacterium]|nr:cupin domain-containing protein [Muribaculaceae bacterium]